MSLPVVIRDTKTGLFLGRGKGWRREWTADVQAADVWTTSGPGINAARQSFTYRERCDLEPGRFEKVLVEVKVFTL